MRVLFVSTNRCREVMPPLPLGIASLVPYLEKKHTLQFLDMMFESRPLEALRKTLKLFDPQVVAFSVRNLENQLMLKPEFYLPEVKGWVDQVRRDCQAKIIVGGAALAVFPQEIFAYLSPDAAVAGEAENSIAPLLEGLESGRISRDIPGLLMRVGQGVHFRGVARNPDLSRLIRPQWKCLDLENYARHGGIPNLVTKRGCAFNCTFCDTPVSEGSQLRMKSPVRVADELAGLLALGFESCFITDAVFNHPEGYAEAVAQECSRRGFSTKWTAILHPRLLTADQLIILKKGGLGTALLGSDHASADMLNHYAKQLSPADLQRADQLLGRFEIPYFMSLLFGGPGETRESVSRALDLVAGMGAKMVFIRTGLRLYPGTPLFQTAVAEGRVGANADLLRPVFYLAKGADDWLVELVKTRAAVHPNWVIAGVPHA